MAVEREVKLTAEGPFELPDLAGVVDGATPVFLAEEKLEATYYDTADLRLARWGITVRYRREGTAGAWWTVKLPDDGKVAGGLSRTELPFPGGPRTVPVEATRLLTGYLRGDSLEPVARLTTRRRRVRLVDDAGAPVVEIDDDRVSVLEGAEVVAWFREIEVEAANGSGEDALAALRRVLLDHGARETVAIPKLVRALGARAMEGPEVEQPQITAHSTAGQVARAAIAAGVTRMVSHDPGVRLGEDSEAVHQARVATRRLRSDLRTFRSLLDEEWVTSVRTELKWVAGALGQVRDADVLLERLRGHEVGLPSADRKAASALLGRLEAER